MGRPAATFLLTLWVSGAFLAAGCGYRLAGTGPDFPPGAGTVSIPNFRNQTFEPYLENVVTGHVRNEFVASRLRVVPGEGGDRVLRGTIVRFDLIPLSFDPTHTVVQEYRMKIRAEVELSDSRSGAVLWKDAGVETTAEFIVSRDTSATRVARDRALAEASRHLAEDLVSRVLEDD